MPSGLNSPHEVFFFTKKPEQYSVPGSGYFYSIREANENTMQNAKARTRETTAYRTIELFAPEVEVNGNRYTYIIRSFASREQFNTVLSPESVHGVTASQGIRGLHFSAVERSGDAIGLSVQADTPEAAKEQFHAWYASVKDALRAVEEQFVVLNRQLDQKIEEAAAQRLEELERPRRAL